MENKVLLDPGDIFQDEEVDLKDFMILAEKWLCSCSE